MRCPLCFKRLIQVYTHVGDAHAHFRIVGSKLKFQCYEKVVLYGHFYCFHCGADVSDLLQSKGMELALLGQERN